MARPVPPPDDGSPARLIATMVGIVGILLLGSLAWSAIGALATAIGSAGAALTSARSAPPTLAPAIAVTPSPTLVVTPMVLATAPPVSTLAPAATPTLVSATAAPVSAGRNPWILLPQPEPGARVTPGQILVEARGRGDAPITSIRLELDGTLLPAALEQRSESTWRGFVSTRVSVGAHTVRATVVDTEGRSGSFRWTFAAGP